MQFQITHGDENEYQKLDRKYGTCLTLQTFKHQTHNLVENPKERRNLWNVPVDGMTGLILKWGSSRIHRAAFLLHTLLVQYV